MNGTGKTRAGMILLIVVLTAAMRAQGQRARGELRIEVHDPQGAALVSCPSSEPRGTPEARLLRTVLARRFGLRIFLEAYNPTIAIGAFMRCAFFRSIAIGLPRHTINDYRVSQLCSVAIVQSAESRKGSNLASSGRAQRHRPTHRRVFSKPQMRPIVVVVADVLSH